MVLYVKSSNLHSVSPPSTGKPNENSFGLFLIGVLLACHACMKTSGTAVKNSMIFMRRRMMAEYPPQGGTLREYCLRQYERESHTIPPFTLSDGWSSHPRVHASLCSALQLASIACFTALATDAALWCRLNASRPPTPPSETRLNPECSSEFSFALF